MKGKNGFYGFNKKHVIIFSWIIQERFMIYSFAEIFGLEMDLAVSNEQRKYDSKRKKVLILYSKLMKIDPEQ